MEPNETIEDLKDQYRSILASEVDNNWVRGDIATIVTSLHDAEIEKNGKSGIIDDFLESTGESRSAFSQYRWVAGIFNDDSLRALPVTWTHYRVCAGLEDRDEAIKWLIKSSDEGWSCSRLIEELKGAKLNKAIDEGLRCSQCDKSVTKEISVSLSINRKGRRPEKRTFCSINCAWLHLSELHQEELAANSSVEIFAT